MKFRITVIIIAAVLLAALVIFFAYQYTPANVLTYVRAGAMEIENGVLTVPEKYTVIEAEALAGRIEFDTVIIKGETDIQSRAFYNCTNLSRIVIEKDCHIGPEAFADCPELSSVVVRTGGGSCSDDAFYGHGGAVVYCPADSPVWEVARRADMSVRELE